MNKSNQPLKRVAIKSIDGYDQPAADAKTSPPPKKVRLFANFHTTLAGIIIFIVGALIIEGYFGSLTAKLSSLPKAGGQTRKNPVLTLNFTKDNSAGLDLVPGPKRGSYGVAFNGAGDYLELSSPIRIPSQNGTISWWMKRDKHKYETIFSSYPDGSGGHIEIDGQPREGQAVALNDYIRIESYTNNEWTASFQTGINTADNQWHHYTLVFGPEKSRLYVDGQLADQNSANTDPKKFSIRYIGHRQSQRNYRYGEWFSGKLAKVIIFNRTLGREEIASIYYGIPVFYFTKTFKYLLLAIIATLPSLYGRIRNRVGRS